MREGGGRKDDRRRMKGRREGGMSRRRRKEEVETDQKDKQGEGTKVATQPHVAPKGVLHPARRGVRAGRVPETQGACVKVGVQKLHG